MSKLDTFSSAQDFLAAAQGDLERDEAANILILGNALRMAADPAGGSPYLAVAADEEGMAAAAAHSPVHGIALASSREQPEAALTLIVEDLLARGLAVSHVFGPAGLAKLFAELWRQRTGGRYELYFTQRLYQLIEVIPPQSVPGGLRPARMEEIPVIAGWISGFDREVWGERGRSVEDVLEIASGRVRAGEMYVWEDGVPAAMAMHSRSTRRVAMVSLVYTLPERRGRGYAAAMVAALSQLLLDQGSESTALYTDASNPLTNRLYQKIGYRPIGTWERYGLKLAGE